MNFPHPQSIITTEGQQSSRVELANEAADARRQAQIKHALARQTNTPQMVRTIDPSPSDQELVRQRNRRLQLRGQTTDDYLAQIRAIEEERADILSRLSSARNSVNDALRAGNNAAVKQIRGRVEDFEIVLARLDLLQQEADDGLQRAERALAGELAALKAQVQGAERRLAAYVKKQATFSEHAEAIAQIVVDEAPAEADHRLLQDAARRLPGYEMPAPFPKAPDGRALRASVVIPGYCGPPARMPTANDAYARD